jgi:hypothetical protein
MGAIFFFFSWSHGASTEVLFASLVKGNESKDFYRSGVFSLACSEFLFKCCYSVNSSLFKNTTSANSYTSVEECLFSSIRSIFIWKRQNKVRQIFFKSHLWFLAFYYAVSKNTNVFCQTSPIYKLIRIQKYHAVYTLSYTDSNHAPSHFLQNHVHNYI